MFGRTKSEVELLEASLAGSTQAFEVVVGRYQSLVCAITYGATGDVGRSEELAQEAFLRAWTNLAQLQDLGKFRAWLYSIARSTVQNWLRSRRSDVIGHAAPLDVAAEKASEESGPEEAVMTQEQQAVVRQALGRMPEALREPLILFYREGKSTREVAELMGLSENAARQRISRGRSLLREQVADMVETAIARTRPGRVFTASVVAAVAAAGFKGSATAAAAGVASGVSALTVKVAAVAVGIAAIVLGTVVYRQVVRVTEAPARPAMVQPVQREPSGEPVPELPVVENDSEAGAAREPADRSETAVAAATPETRTGSEVSPDDKDRPPLVSANRAVFEFKPKGVLSGRITDIETGEPVRDARLAIWVSRVYTVRADANGFYCLDRIDKAGDFRVSVVSQEYIGIPDDDRSSLVHLDPDKQAVRHFELHKACMIDVWIADANGVGIKDAKVVATSLTDARKREINRSVFSSPQTDPNGYLLLGGFPPADTDYVITAWHTVETGYEQRGSVRFTRSECDYAPASVTVRLTDPNVVRQIQIVLERGLTVQARAEYEDGQPAADTDIELKPTWWHCNYVLPRYRTDSDGTFLVKHVTSGLYDISVSTPTGDFGSVSRKVMQAQLPPADGASLVVRLPGVSPQSQVAISGSLVFRGEKKPSYVNIEAYSRTGQLVHGSVERKPDGDLADTFTVDRLEPGTYTLTFSGDNIEETSVPNVAAPSTGVQVELVYASKPRLVGNVVDARTGEPIRGFRVRVKKLRTLRGAPYVQMNRWVDYENERGEFGLDVSGPGVYQVQAIAEGYAPAWSEPLNTDETTPAVVALSQGGVISGRVVDERGAPVDGAKVIPLSLAGGTMVETEDLFVCEEGAVETVGGAFSLPQTPLGVETLKVTHPEYAPQIMPEVLVAAGRNAEGVRVILTRGGTIEGYVYDLQGRPQTGQVLSAQDAAGPDGTTYPEASRLGQAVTDANGFYRFEHLPERLCHIKRMNEWESLGVVCRAIVPRDGRVLRLDLGGVPVVRGRVVLDGVPAAAAKLMIGLARSPHTGAFRGYTVTDEQGDFTFGGAPPGVYAVYCERQNERTRWMPVGTITIGDADMDVGVLPAKAPGLLLTLHGADETEGRRIDSVFLSTGQRLWATPVATAEPPSKQGGPYTIRNVRPGPYVLNVVRQDQVQWQQPIELGPDEDRWERTLDVPSWNASVSGRIDGAGRALVLRREQKDVIAVLQIGRDRTFRVQHLPAGRYTIGDMSSALYNLPPMAEFVLGENEEKVLDLDLSGMRTGQIGFAIVQVVDEFGRVCDNAQVRLDGPLGPAQLVQSAETGLGFLTTPGLHTLHVQVTGYQAVTRKVNVKPFDPDLGRPQIVLVCLNAR